MDSSIIFTITGIIHFLISVGALVSACDCPLTLLAGMVYGGCFVPFVVVINSPRPVKETTVIMIFCCVCVFVGGFMLRFVDILCNERLLFMGFVHGFVVPGIILSIIKFIQ